MQKGFAQIFVILLLLAGLAAGLYLVGKQTFFKPKASLTGTRIEFIGSNIKGDIATSKDITLKIYYEPKVEPTTLPSVTPIPTLEPTPSPTPVPTPTPITVPTPKPLPPDFTEEWGVNWKQIPAGNYTLTFEDPTNDPQAVVPSPIDIEVKEKATTEVKVSTDGKVLDCGATFCIKYYPDSAISSGQLRVETVPAKGFKITVSAKSILGVAYGANSRYPTHFRVANCSTPTLNSFCQINLQKDSTDHKAERVWSGGFKELPWLLDTGNGKKYVFAQFSFDEGSSWEETTSSEIALEKPKSEMIDLATYFRDPQITKTHYLFEGLTQTDKRKHPDWDTDAPRGALWFEMINDHTWRQYNYNPADVNRRCAYDEWTFDDTYVRYVNTTHGPNCDPSGKTTQSIFDPPVVEFPRYWDESAGPTHYSDTHEHLDVQNGVEVCRKTDEANNSILGWEEVAPGVKAIHIKIQSKTVSSNCPYDKDFINKDYEEHYWLAPLPIEGQPGKTAWGVKRTMGGNVEDQWAREKKGECNFSRDQYAVDEINKLKEQNHCPFYWDIWHDLYKKLPENMDSTPAPTPQLEGVLRVKTDPAVAATITIKSIASGAELFKDNWGVNWRKLPAGKYEISFSYPYPQIHNLPTKIPSSVEVEIKPGQTTGIVVDLTKGTTRPATDKD